MFYSTELVFVTGKMVQFLSFPREEFYSPKGEFPGEMLPCLAPMLHILIPVVVKYSRDIIPHISVALALYGEVQFLTPIKD